MTEPSERRTSSRGGRELGLAAGLLLIGGGLAVLGAARTWATVTLHRSAPLASVDVDVAGRTLHPAVTAFGVVALAGVVALLATRGWARRVLGALLFLAGGLLMWSAALGFESVGPTRARSLVLDARTGIASTPTDTVSVSASVLWPSVALLGGVSVLAGGVLVALRGGVWSALSARYERPSAPTASSAAAPAEPALASGDDARARADLALWQSLERGEDPTV